MHFEPDNMRLTHQCCCWMEADDELLKRLREDEDSLDQRIRIERILLLGGEASWITDIFPGHVAHLWQRGLVEIVMGADKMRQARFEHDSAAPRSSFA